MKPATALSVETRQFSVVENVCLADEGAVAERQAAGRRARVVADDYRALGAAARRFPGLHLGNARRLRPRHVLRPPSGPPQRQGLDKTLFFEPHHRMYWYCLSVNGS